MYYPRNKETAVFGKACRATAEIYAVDGGGGSGFYSVTGRSEETMDAESH